MILVALLLAQGFGPPIPDPQGVDLDAEGVIRLRETAVDPRLAEIRKKGVKQGDLCYVSLPRLLAEAKKCVDEGRPIPDSIRYLGGLVKIQYVFVYPEEGDLVLAGRAEPFDTKVPFRPLGHLSGRPVLHLDDLIVALRACSSGKIPPRIGCDIEVTKEIVERCQAKLKELTPKAQEMGGKKVAEAIAQAGGNQAVVYYSIPADSRFAVVCAEADYLLKQLALGLLKSPVSKVRSYNNMITKPERHHRFSLDSSYDALLVSPEGDAFELRGPSLKINTGLLQRLGSQDGEMSNAAKDFMNSCNKHFDEMSRHILSWADLANLSDLSVVAALIMKDGLHSKAKWDLSWVLDTKACAVGSVSPIKFAHRLCNHHYAGNMLLFTHGGVLINPGEWIGKQAKDEEGKLKKPARPDGLITTPNGK